MPSREWRKCETCEWSGQQVDGDLPDDRVVCFHVRSVWPGFDDGDVPLYSIIRKNGWCSEWKSAEPETCGMCHWFRLFDGSSFKGICNHVTAGAHNYESRLGACDHFRRCE